MVNDPVNAAPGEFEKATRLVAGVALGEATAARVLAFGIACYLVKNGTIPRLDMIEVIDHGILAIEEQRPNSVTGAADLACERLRTLLEHVRGGL